MHGTHLNRKEPAVAAWTLLLIFFCGTLAAADAPKDKAPRPNIVVCIADDWSWPHAGAYGDRAVRTPNFDRVAREGALFTQAFCATPSCSPSRAAILTGQWPHRLREGANLWGFLPNEFQVYPDRLEQAGYVIGLRGKGWGPGRFQAGGRIRNPAGPTFQSFDEFMKTVPAGRPFCFWYGSSDPHRPYAQGSGLAAGLKPEDVFVLPYFPDRPEVRSDLLDYYSEVQRFDRDVGELLKTLEAAGQLGRTIVIVTSDNGMPFPRCKTNLHDSGSRLPLAIRWPGKVKAGRVIPELVSLSDLAPTLLQAAGLRPLPGMTGQTLLPLLLGKKQSGRKAVFIERERHANVRQGDLGYPARAIRTKEFLYIRNLRPERWPGGDPQMWRAVGEFGDCDNGPTKELLLSNRERYPQTFALAFDKRPAEELYDLPKDPLQVNNVAARAEYSRAKRKLRAQLQRWMERTADPRGAGGGDTFDTYPYFGEAKRMPAALGKPEP